MADYTDRPFGLLCREIAGNDFLIFREMVSAEAVVRGNEKTLHMCEFGKKERPIITQIFGYKPEVMAKAAKIIDEKFQPDGIDINMGCPVPKIAQRSKAGASLMRHPNLAVEIIEKILGQNIRAPLSVKTRLGWQRDDEIFDFAKRLQDAGVKLVSIHGRTRIQGYSGAANWERIGEVKRILHIPVLANGDIKSREDIKECLEITHADGVMIGRGALGNPWILCPRQVQMTAGTIARAILRHAELHVKHYGERGVVILRKHLPWYIHGERAKFFKNPKKIRSLLVRVNSLSELRSILSNQ